MPRSICVAPALLAALLSTAQAQQLKTETVTVDVRPGATMRYLAVSAGEPKAALILLPGGNGALKLDAGGQIGGLSGNFLIRSRGMFAREGLYVAALDAASDQQGGMNGQVRLSPQHAQDIAKVIADVKTRAGVPVWVIGTSAGTLSTANIGARLRADRPHGVVFTSTMTQLQAGHCGKSVYDAQLSAISVPVLVVSHSEDGCGCSPGGAGPNNKLLAALSGASVKEQKVFSGGTPPVSAPCEAKAQHGYFGIEASVVKAVADWIKSH
ncbi:MAG TPA: hypothetical protein VFK79_14540 [Xanthobacteraceae bacterium]|nr:hypothetical protein [Xanthobacteraceae bacterium]